MTDRAALDAAVADLARTHGTPLYIYSKAAFLARYHEIADAFASCNPLVCYSVKSNGNLAVLKTLGFSSGAVLRW